MNNSATREILEDLKWKFEDILSSDFVLENDDEIRFSISVAEIKALLELIKTEVS